ncbi:MAG: hypothetical protein JO033_04995 [Acidobacteriaceae bacterium]|nr:hypothetical protein [Acidobacteriaceae bacterium]MBV9501379.1 hypothetical protein [Acidobacteriaceae bacterium]
MPTSIELPERVYRELERIARAKGYTPEQLVVLVLEHEFSRETLAAGSRTRVSLPLIHSKHPATLDLSNFDFDDLLA